MKVATVSTLPPHKNRLYRGDCLEAMKRMVKEGIEVDLIYLDPPFNSNRVYNLIFNKGGKDAQQVAFNDAWGGGHAEQLRLAFTDMLDEMDIPVGLKNIVKMWVDVLLQGNNSDRRLLNYLIYITERLIWMHKVLSPTGSIYLHCDPTASHYIKVMMDAVFGRDNFRNEVIWSYRTGGTSKYWFSKKHDVILFYSKTKEWHFKKLTEKSYNREYKRYNFKGVKEFRDDIFLEPYGWHTMIGMRDVWDIQALGRTSKERMGYDTQKPVALLERIIKASCPEGGVILDTFCGCGTTIEAAANLKRHWIGVDISRYAIENIEQRIKSDRISFFDYKNYELVNCTPETFKEYEKLGHYEKQKFLVEKLGGVVGVKGGDKGVDGTIKIHIGDDKQGKPQWGEMILSVKTGNQSAPAHLRELQGTMQNHNAVMAGLILDKEPSQKMEKDADASRKLKYKTGNYTTEFSSLQIITSDEILNGGLFDIPPTLMKKKEESENSLLL